MSVPLFWNADGLPVDTQFIERFGDEATLFHLAAQFEEAWPWAGHRPPVSARTLIPNGTNLVELWLALPETSI